jgi:putative transposase
LRSTAFPPSIGTTCGRRIPFKNVFATVRHRTVRTKGSLSSTTAKMMVFKLLCAASKTWRRLKRTNQLPKVIAGVRFKDGIEVIEVPSAAGGPNPRSRS